MWPESPEPEQGAKPPALKTGLTTGCCATACVVAAAQFLFNKDSVLESVFVTLPKKNTAKTPQAEKTVTLVIEQVALTECGAAKASTIKDAGDDPDVTHGARVWAMVRLASEAGVEFLAGEGVGTVTREGLSLAVGESAINPVPRQMIEQHLQNIAEQFAYQGGFTVTIGVENGAALALKTMNPKLGIVGGLSILGTTGIVRPFSCSAYIASIHQGVDVALANNQLHLGASTGNLSEQALQQRYHLPEMALIEMGDFIGALLKHLRARAKQNSPLPRLLSLCLGFGKLTKLAAGHMDLHSRSSSIDFDCLANWAQQKGADQELQETILQANTSIEVLSLCNAQGIDLISQVCEHALMQVKKIVPSSVEVEIFAIDRRGNIIGESVDKHSDKYSGKYSGKRADERSKNPRLCPSFHPSFHPSPINNNPILILGGTGEALALADALYQNGVNLIYSLAGRVRMPQRQYAIHSGGFSETVGLEDFVLNHSIAAVLDATHPFARRMTAEAQRVCETSNLPYWRWSRKPWQANQPSSHWFEFDDMDSLILALSEKRSVLFTSGHLSADQLEQLTLFSRQRQIIRTAVTPNDMPTFDNADTPDKNENRVWLQDIGPFSVEQERALFEKYSVDALVTKNSGGSATLAKLQVAKERQVPVFLLKRPPEKVIGPMFEHIEECVEYVVHWIKTKH